jgi:hypothetical protein
MFLIIIEELVIINLAMYFVWVNPYRCVKIITHKLPELVAADMVP